MDSIRNNVIQQVFTMRKGKVYIVRGSEDGNLGVYTSMVKALGRAKSYVQQHGGKAKVSRCSGVPFYVENTADSTTAKIEIFDLNADYEKWIGRTN